MSPASKTCQEVGNVEKWIVEARAGSLDALGRLLDACRRYLLLVANRKLAPALRAKVDPSDIVQDTMLEAGRDFSSFHGATEEALLGWLRRILRNNVANTRRHFETEKRGMDREISLEEAADAVLFHRALKQSETPSVQAQAREQDEQLQWAVQQLSEHYRRILLLHTSEGLTFVQIAAKLNNSPDAIRKLWGRAVELLAKHLKSPHESP